MTAGIIITRLTAVTAPVSGGDPLPRSGPGGLPSTDPRQ